MLRALPPRARRGVERGVSSRFQHVQRLLRSKLSTARPLCTLLMQEVAAARISRRPARCVQDSARRRPMTQLIWTLERFLSMEAIEMVHAGAERPAEKAIDDVRRAAAPRPSPWRGAKFGLFKPRTVLALPRGFDSTIVVS